MSGAPRADGRGGLMMLTSSFPSGVPGSEAAGAFVADLARECAATLPVHVLAPGEDDHVGQLGERLWVHRYRAPQRPLSTLRASDPRDWPAIASVLAHGRGRALAVARDVVPARLLALWAAPAGAWARAVARRTGIPYDAWVLGSDIWSLGRIPLVRRWIAGVLRGAARRYADGVALGDEAQRLCGLPFEFLPSARTLPAGVREPAPAAGRRVAFLGRWHPNKGPDLLLAALARLDDGDWSRIAACTIAGGGPLEPQVRAGIEALRAAGRPVALRGYLDRDEAAALLRATDVLCIPSRIESIPVVFSDAMQCGCAVATMPVGDLPTLVARHRCGWTADRVDDAAFAAALRRALVEPLPDASALAAAAAAFSVAGSAARILRP